METAFIRGFQGKARNGWYLKFLGEKEIVAEQEVETLFAQVDKNTKLELLAPLNGKGPIQQFLDKKGPGMHHLCFRVEDVVEKANELKKNGFRLLYDEPKVGAHNCLVNFIHPKSTGGVLIELSQRQDKGAN